MSDELTPDRLADRLDQFQRILEGARKHENGVLKVWSTDPDLVGSAASALRSYAAAQEQEPVAWRYRWKIDGEWVSWRVADASQKSRHLPSLEEIPLYTRAAIDCGWECMGRKQSLPEPGECDWPICGCDPSATKAAPL